MAGVRLSRKQRATILQLHEDGAAVGEIAVAVKKHRNTVSRVLSAAGVNAPATPEALAFTPEQLQRLQVLADAMLVCNCQCGALVPLQPQLHEAGSRVPVTCAACGERSSIPAVIQPPPRPSPRPASRPAPKPVHPWQQRRR